MGLAQPKSITFKTPSGVISMLVGFKSPWLCPTYPVSLYNFSLPWMSLTAYINCLKYFQQSNSDKLFSLFLSALFAWEITFSSVSAYGIYSRARNEICFSFSRLHIIAWISSWISWMILALPMSYFNAPASLSSACYALFSSLSSNILTAAHFLSFFSW